MRRTGILGRPWATPALPLLLLVVLVAVNALAVAGMVSARRGAREAALQDLGLQTSSHARAVEAALAELRRDLVILTRVPALHELMVSAGGVAPIQPPLRAAAAAAMASFFHSHPALHAAALRDNSGAALVLMARRRGVATRLATGSDPPAPIAQRGLFVAELPVAGRIRERGMLEVWIDTDALLALVVPAAHARLALLTQGDRPPTDAGERLVVTARVRDPAWSPPIEWTLQRDERGAGLAAPMAELATPYRHIALLNVSVMALTLLLGFLAFQQVQRSAALAAENRHQARLRELERQILHAERLASVGRLAAGIAHEVNNPLEGTFNYLSLLEEDLAAGDVDGARGVIARIREGLARVAAVTRQMLSLSDAGRVEKAPLDLREPIAGAAEFVRSHRALRHVAVRLDLPASPVTVDGNAVTLGQLFLNLLLNAGQSQNGRGEVEVRCRTAAGRALVSVTDSGPGLSAEAEERLFEPFFSTRGSIGLGLAVCAGIVRDHGGTIRGRNVEGRGAELLVELPLRGAARGDGGQAA